MTNRLLDQSEIPDWTFGSSTAGTVSGNQSDFTFEPSAFGLLIARLYIDPVDLVDQAPTGFSFGFDITEGTGAATFSVEIAAYTTPYTFYRRFVVTSDQAHYTLSFADAEPVPGSEGDAGSWDVDQFLQALKQVGGSPTGDINVYAYVVMDNPGEEVAFENFVVIAENVTEDTGGDGGGGGGRLTTGGGGGIVTSLLSVRLDDGAGNNRVVTHQRLSFRKIAYGGMAGISATVNARPFDFADLGPNDRIYVEDHAGRVLCEGYLDQPGVTAGPRGFVYDITANGPAALAGDFSEPYILIDTALENWNESQYTTPNADTSTAEHPLSDTEVLMAKATEGVHVHLQWQADWIYRAIARAGGKLARVTAKVLAGLNDADYQMQLATRDGSGSATVVEGLNASTTEHMLNGSRGGGNPIPAGDDVVSLRTVRNNTTDIGDTNRWFDVYDIVLRALLKDEFGTDIVTGYSDDFVTSDQVVRDMIGRGLLPKVDLDMLTITAGTTEIDQFANPDGIAAAGVFDALAMHEPDIYWGYGASNADGDHEFWYQPWNDDDPRYILDDDLDQVNLPGGVLCNRIVVSFTTPGGKTRTVTRNSDVDELGDRVVDAEAVSLPPEYGTAANAVLVGDRILASKSTALQSGTAVVRRRIKDLHTGQKVWPWEIEPGCCIQRASTGATIRLSEMQYDDDGRAATLTLGVPPLTVDELTDQMTKRAPMLKRHVDHSLWKATWHLKHTKKKKG